MEKRGKKEGEGKQFHRTSCGMFLEKGFELDFFDKDNIVIKNLVVLISLLDVQDFLIAKICYFIEYRKVDDT